MIKTLTGYIVMDISYTNKNVKKKLTVVQYHTSINGDVFYNNEV